HLKEMVKSNSEATKTLEALGFDPFKDLTSVTVGITLVPGSEREPKGLVIAQGVFDVAKFQSRAEEFSKDKPKLLQIHKEGNHKIYEVKPPQSEDKPGFVALIDKETVVASNDKQLVLDALAKAGGKQGSVKKELQDLISATDTNQSLWF